MKNDRYEFIMVWSAMLVAAIVLIGFSSAEAAKAKGH
jgi:hypothetical protein